MSERQPSTSLARLEGNVRLPQVMSGIAAFGLKAAFDAENPADALAYLAAPIRLEDETLLNKVKKANAQHVHYGIDRTVDAEEVRVIEIQGNLFMIERLGNFLKVKKRPLMKNAFKVDESGKWGSPEVRQMLQGIQEKIRNLSPQELLFIRTLFSTLVAFYKRPDIADRLHMRREMYRNYDGRSVLKSLDTKNETNTEFFSVQKEASEYVMSQVEKIPKITEKQKAIASAFCSIFLYARE